MLRAEGRLGLSHCWRVCAFRLATLLLCVLASGAPLMAAEEQKPVPATNAPQLYAPNRDFNSENRPMRFKPRAENARTADAKEPVFPGTPEAGARATDVRAAGGQTEELKKKGVNGSISAVFLVVVVLAVFLVLGLWALKKLLPGGKNLFPTAAMEILGRTHFDQQKYLALVRVGKRVVVVGVAPGGFDAVAEITDPEEVTELLAEAKPKTAAGRNLFHRMFQSQLAGAERDAVLAETSRPAGQEAQAGDGAVGLTGAAGSGNYAELQARVRSLRESE